jgi:hypothetical protein
VEDLSNELHSKFYLILAPRLPAVYHRRPEFDDMLWVAEELGKFAGKDEMLAA